MLGLTPFAKGLGFTLGRRTLERLERPRKRKKVFEPVAAASCNKSLPGFPELVVFVVKVMLYFSHQPRGFLEPQPVPAHHAHRPLRRPVIDINPTFRKCAPACFRRDCLSVKPCSHQHRSGNEGRWTRSANSSVLWAGPPSQSEGPFRQRGW